MNNTISVITHILSFLIGVVVGVLLTVITFI